MLPVERDHVLLFPTRSSIVISVPHEGIESGWTYHPRPWNRYGVEHSLSTIVSGLNGKSPIASVVKGLLPRTICDYNRPSKDTGGDHAFFDERVATSWNRYHDILTGVLKEAKMRAGRAILIDLHGFRSARSGLNHHLVLGSCGGQTAPCGIDERACAFFRKCGHDSRLAGASGWYSGGYTLKRHGGDGTSALQIEVTDRLRTAECEPQLTQLGRDLRAFLLEEVSP